MKISIIVPVYNTPRYELEECINSILRNNFIDFEVIIIDDGSREECAALLDCFAVKYGNVKVYHRKNHGVSASRNYGVQVANGKYIMFVDSDDILKVNILNTAYSIAEINNADIVIGGIWFGPRAEVVKESVSDDTRKYEVISKEEKRELQKHFMRQYKINEKYKNFEKNGHFESGPWARLVKRELALETLFHKELKIGEDDIWNQELLMKECKVILDYRIWYNYISSNDFSALNRYRENIAEEVSNYLYYLSKVASDFEIFPYDEFYNRCLVQMEKFLYSYLMHADCKMKFFEKMQAIRNIMKQEQWKKIYAKERIKDLKVKHKVKIWLYRTGMIIPFYLICKGNR